MGVQRVCAFVFDKLSTIGLCVCAQMYTPNRKVPDASMLPKGSAVRFWGQFWCISAILLSTSLLSKAEYPVCVDLFCLSLHFLSS